MNARFTSQPTLEDIQREARTLFLALQSGDPSALQRHYALDPLAGLIEPKLAEAQYLIAREHGYNSWRKLKENLHTTSWNC